MADLKERVRAGMADFKKRMLAVKAPSEFLRLWFHKETVASEKICTTCSHIGVPVDEMAGRREIELTLWTIFLGISLLFLGDVLVGEAVNNLKFLRLVHALQRVLKRVGELFAFLSLVYTIFRFSTQLEKCAKCHGSTVIPLDSPRGKELLKGR